MKTVMIIYNLKILISDDKINYFKKYYIIVKIIV